MALPTSGQLSLKDIGVEQGITAGNQASLRSMSSTAGYSTPDTVSEFYGYSAGDNITASWGTSYSPSPLTSTTIGLARVINLSGLSGATIRAGVQMNITSIDSGCVSYLHWSTSSSSGPWTSAGSRTTTGTTLFYLPHNAYVSSAQTLYARQYLTKITSGDFISGNLTLTSNYAVGSGTVSSYSGSGSWSISF